MPDSEDTIVAKVAALWRYPVKSMMGEELNATGLSPRGLAGDRAYALVDSETGKLVSAKNPRRWPNLFDFRAALLESPDDTQAPAVKITLPDGTSVTGGKDDFGEVLSRTLGRTVTLETTPPDRPAVEEYWPDLDRLDHRDTVTDEETLAGGFFDGAPVHLLTTATIDRLRELYPAGRFEVRRFRPNIVLQPSGDQRGFVENDWIGHTLAIGEEVRLRIERGCPRCVMTTLAQGDLPADTGVLRTAAQHNEANVGVYVSVLQGGTIRRGDAVRVEV